MGATGSGWGAAIRWAHKSDRRDKWDDWMCARGSEWRNSRTREFGGRDSQVPGLGRAIGESGWWEVNLLRIGQFCLGDQKWAGDVCRASGLGERTELGTRWRM